MRQTDFFVILDHFLPFYPPNNPKNQNFEKMKKLTGDIILYSCNINDNHMMYGSWDTKHGRQDFLWFWTIFCKTKWKKHIEISPVYTSVPKIIIISYFLPFTTPAPPLSPTVQKIKMKKMKKNPGDIIIFHMCTKIMIRWCTVPEIWCTTDRWTDGRMEKVTYWGGCPT